MVTRLERAELKRRKSKAGREPNMWTGGGWCLGSRVGSVGHLTEELSYYNTEVSSVAAPLVRSWSLLLFFCVSYSFYVLESIYYAVFFFIFFFSEFEAAGSLKILRG